MKYVSFLILISFICFGKPSPYFKKFSPKNFISISSGLSGYVGDIIPFTVYRTTGFKSLKPNLGIGFMHTLKNNVRYTLNLQWNQISANDRYYDSCLSYLPNFVRNLNFTTDMLEMTTSLQYDLPINHFTPYIFGGFGGFIYRKKGDDDLKSSICLPFGLGIKTKLNKKFDLGVELNYRYTFTDDLDGILDERVYKQIGSPSVMKGPDLFYTVQLKLIYQLPNNIRCPDILAKVK